MEHLGTPFVTTKEGGTGLGLATCYSIARRHHATIGPETGKDGTTFTVRFPVAGGQELAAGTGDRGRGVGGGSGRGIYDEG